MTVKRRVERLEAARPAGGPEPGRRFCDALSRAYGNGEPIEPMSMAEFEATLEEVYRVHYRPPQLEV